MIETLAERANADDWLVHRGRRLTLRFLLGVGTADYIVSIRDGRIESVAPRKLPTDTGAFSIRAAGDVWADFWSAEPPRDRHDIFSMVAAGLATLDGDLLPLMQNLQYFKDLLAAPRAAAVEA
ncbi:MAG: hypothetical protein WD767_13480 [Alphaproteobacteria bacterium]